MEVAEFLSLTVSNWKIQLSAWKDFRTTQMTKLSYQMGV